MGLDGSKVDIKAFIEGVEVPILGFSTRERLGVVAQATLSLPYLKSVKDLLPRSLVHVFVYDEAELYFPVEEIPEGTPPEDIFPDPVFSEGNNLHNYKLAFWGEIAGKGRTESALGGHAQIFALGFSNYFDTVKQISALRGRGTFSDTERRFVGVEDPISTGRSGQYSTADRVTQLLRDGSSRVVSRTSTLPQEELRFIDEVAESIEARGQGYDFRVREDEIISHLRDRGVELPSGYDYIVRRLVRSWNISSDLLESAKDTLKYRESEETRVGNSGFQEGLKTLLLEFIEGTNEFYRNRSDIFRLSDMLRALEDDESAESLMDLGMFRRFLRQSLGRRGIFTIRDVLGIIGGILFHDLVEHASPTYFPYLSQDALRDLGSTEVDENEQVVTRETQVDMVSAIVFKPELWWTSPPACNVIFPSQYSQVRDTSNELEEPTRTILKISPGVSGSRTTIADDYFAPNIEALNELSAGKELSEQEVFQLPHERFKGIMANVAMLDEELARLTRRDEYQDYMRSYVQFLHWREIYKGRTVAIDSKRLLPWVLVGHPAVALDKNIVDRAEPQEDPYLEERMFLRRELAALRRCLRRLRARRRSLLNYYNSLIHNTHYIEWLRSNRTAVWAGDRRWDIYDETELERKANIIANFDLVVPEPAFNISDASRRAQILWTARGPQLNDAPPHNPETLRRALGDDAGPIIQVDGNISLYTGHPDAEEHLGNLIYTMLSEQASIRKQIEGVDADIARVERAIRELRDRLLELGWDLGTYEHTLFYVFSKETQISTDKVSTSIQGMFARTHDEDIDLDGTRGDTFENIIKTGAGEFISDSYAADNIGRQFYQPVYGVKSLVDMGAELQPLTEHENDTLDDEMFSDSDEEIPYWREVLRDICQRDYEETSASEGVSIEDALDIVVEVYRSLGLNSSDVESFVSRFVARPIATIVDVLGSDILRGEFGEHADRYGNYKGSQASSGAGFHQFAFLSEDETFDMSGLEGRESDQLHVATARRSRVLDYVRELASRDFTT